MNTFFDPVNNTAAVEQLNKELGKDGGRTVLISGCIDTQKVHISSAIASGYKYMLIVTSDEAKARKMCDDASFFNKEAIYYPACLLYTSPSPRDRTRSRMPSSA